MSEPINKDQKESEETFDWEKRKEEKRLSREKDYEDIRTGKRTPQQVQDDNNMFRGLKSKIDWAEYFSRLENNKK